MAENDDIDLSKEYEKLSSENEVKKEDPFKDLDKSPQESVKETFTIKDIKGLTNKIMEDTEGERQRLIKEGYIPGILLDQYISTGKILKRATTFYEVRYQDKLKKGELFAEGEDYAEFNNISEVANQFIRLQSAIDAQREKSQVGLDIHTMHQKEIDENAKFIQQSIGEHSFLCSNCKSVISAGGLVHWAIKTSSKSGETIYHVWSKEMAWAVKKGLLPVYLMAFALVTSPEGLLYTAQERGENLPPFDINEEEKKLRKILDEYEQ